MPSTATSSTTAADQKAPSTSSTTADQNTASTPSSTDQNADQNAKSGDLPQTASPLPLLGLLGLGSLVTGLVARKK
ncbi:MAG TPA: hypothetical protein VG488_07900 [Candidatus Angelobacter sp.]|jgi:hypothetical protein|nr:hypothetical protein [Candidatus Angelobacter sp.]